MAVTSSLHQPPSLQFTAEAASNSPVWVPLALEGSWPFDKVVEQAVPDVKHQIITVHNLSLGPLSLWTPCTASALRVACCLCLLWR